MTTKDKQNIRMLFHSHRYHEGTLSALYGVTQQRISIILLEERNVTAIPIDDCIICGLDGAKEFYIDGNIDNNKPQNKIMLCEADMKRIKHMQMRKDRGSLTAVY